MKKLFVFLAAACLLCGCGDPDDGPSPVPERFEPPKPFPTELPSIIGTWRTTTRYYCKPDGKYDWEYAHNTPAYVFSETGFYRYFGGTDGVYDSAYHYDTRTRRLEMGPPKHRVSVHVSLSNYLDGTIRWIYDADENGNQIVEELVPDSELQLQGPPEKEEDMAIYIPDKALREYMVHNFDMNHDYRISAPEAARIEVIAYTDRKIASLEGIEYCTRLKELNCAANLLTDLDVSQNPDLEDFRCFLNQLTTLDVSQNRILRYLDCSSNQLTTLDVSRNVGLWSLHCSYNQLTSIDVNRNKALETLDCSNNQLTTLDVSRNTKLNWLFCGSNQLTTLDVSQNTALTDLRCYNNQLTVLDISRNTQLKSLDCSDNQLTSLDVSQNTALERLSCYNNQLTTLDVSNCKNLKTLDLNPMPSLQTLYLATGQTIENMQIPETTQVIYK